MNGSVILILGMASGTVACGITEKILNALGKSDAAQIVNIVFLSSIATTCAISVAKFIQAVKGLA